MPTPSFPSSSQKKTQKRFRCQPPRRGVHHTRTTTAYLSRVCAPLVSKQLNCPPPHVRNTSSFCAPPVQQTRPTAFSGFVHIGQTRHFFPSLILVPKIELQQGEASISRAAQRFCSHCAALFHSAFTRTHALPPRKPPKLTYSVIPCLPDSLSHKELHFLPFFFL